MNAPTILQPKPETTRIEWSIDSTTEGWESWVQLRADAHWDNPDANRDFIDKANRQAIERQAAIIDVGDHFCLMQGKYDPRKTLGKIRDEHAGADYLNRIVRTATDYYADVAPLMARIGHGNHETKVIDRCGFDVTAEWAQSLRIKHGSNVAGGGYTGWVRFLFRRSTQIISKRLWFCHGYAGGGQVTKDMIQANRQMVYITNADIMCSGHTHDAWNLPTVRLEHGMDDVVRHREGRYLKVGTAKDEYKKGLSGWHVETGKPPKPIHWWWLRFFWHTERQTIDFEVQELRP